MDILHVHTRRDPDATDPTTARNTLDRLAVESRRTAHIMSYAARSEDADDLARDVMEQFADFAHDVANICEEVDKRIAAPSGSRRSLEPRLDNSSVAVTRSG